MASIEVGNWSRFDRSTLCYFTLSQIDGGGGGGGEKGCKRVYILSSPRCLRLIR